jgi:two-component system, sporulation sensor kinase E
MRAGFLEKLIARLDRLDPQSLQAHFLRLSRERGLLETVFQSIQEGVAIVSGDGRLNYANRAMEQLLGFTFAAAKGRPVARFFPFVEWDRLLNLDETEWSKLISSEIEVTYPAHRFLSFYLVPFAPSQSEGGAEDDEAGESGGLIVILRDVTASRLREADALESERLNAVKLLAAGVAHEIGNPLNALNIHLQLLERSLRAVPAESRAASEDLLRVARGEVQRLDLIITQFLRAIRPTKPRMASLDVAGVLQDTLLLFQREIEDKAVDVALDIPPLAPKVQADRDQIKQAFFNIVKNALQSMTSGGSLRIGLGVSAQYLSVSFADSGSGIGREDLGRIFEPYYTTKAGGSGLGLMIVQRIAQDHGGQIEIESKPGEGTVFTFLLPLVRRRMRLLPRGERTATPPSAESET